MTTTTFPRPSAIVRPRPFAPSIPAVTPVDLATLTTWQLRVAIYASGFALTGDDHLGSPAIVLRRLTIAVTAAVERLGVDTIRMVADFLEHAYLHFDTALTARFCPDTIRWNFTASTVNYYRTHTSQTRLPLHLIDALADQLNPVVA